MVENTKNLLKGDFGMKKMRAIICIFLVILTSASVVSCGGSSNTPAPSGAATPGPSGPTATGSDPSGSGELSLDDYVVIKMGIWGQGRLYAGLTPGEANLATDAIYDTMFRADPETKEIFSYCLDDWYWEDDTTFIMVLREGVYFSNGVEATAEDVVYSYTSYHERGSTFLNDYKIIWDECYARDRYTAVIKLEAFYAPFEQWLVFLHNKEWSQSVGWDSMEWFNPVGSGPYYCAEYVPDQRIVLKAREDYWDLERQGPIYVDEYQLINYPDPATMYMDLETGKLDITPVLSTDYSRYMEKGADGLECVLIPIGTNMSFHYCFINNPVWYNKKLREAIAIGVDWAEIGKAALQNAYIPARGICPVDSPEFIDAGWDDLTYNPELAKEMLAELGYTPDNPLKLYAISLSSATSEPSMEALQYFFSELGIELGIEFADIATTMDIWRTRYGEPGLVDVGFFHVRRGSAAYDLRAGIVYARVPTQSICYVDDETGKFAELYAELVSNPDLDKRRQAGAELQQLVRDEYLMIPVAEFAEPMGYRTDVLTKEQIDRYVTASTIIQTSRLGMLSAWQ